MKKIIWLMMAALLLQLPLSCNRLEPEDDGENPFTPISLSTKQQGYVQAGTQFAWRFLDKVDEQSLQNKEKEWFVSPLSLQIALGLLLNGAQNETATEICQTLGYNEGETAEINAWCKLMLEQLPKLDKKTDLVLANAVFYNKKLQPKGPYRDAVTSWYEAQLEALDFTKTKASADAINKVSKRLSSPVVSTSKTTMDENDGNRVFAVMGGSPLSALGGFVQLDRPE